MSESSYGLMLAVLAVGAGIFVGLLLDSVHSFIAKRRYRKKIRK
jgi:uncharacterized protein YneF (UPF0154 family)